MVVKFGKRNYVKYLFYVEVTLIIIVYFLSLRIVEGQIFRLFLFMENSIFNVTLLKVSFFLLVFVLSQLSSRDKTSNNRTSKNVMLELTFLLLLMFPGTGLGAKILTPLGVPELLTFIMSGISYCFIPLFYTLNIRKQSISELGFEGRKYIFEDLKAAFIIAFLSLMIIDPVTSIMKQIVGFQSVSAPLGLPLYEVPLSFMFHGVGMIQNIAWNGLIQHKIERGFNWSLKGFIVSFSVLALLLQAYFEPKANLQSLIAYAPGNTIGLLIMCYLFHKTKRIYAPALWHWFTNFFGMISLLYV